MRNLVSSVAAIALAASLGSYAEVAAGRDASGSAPVTPASAPPAASTDAANGTSGMFDIVVTARKHEGKRFRMPPVAVSAFGDKFLNNFHVESVDDLTTFSPGLLNFERPGYQASGIYLRGIGTTIESALAEGSVAIVVDGVEVPGYMQRAAGFDLSRIEVLRGPQALFYSKGTPAGVISMITAAADRFIFELHGNVGYETVASEKYGEVVASGPLTSNLSGRLGVRYSNMVGFLHLQQDNIANLTLPLPADRGPNRRDVTIKGDPQVGNPVNNFRRDPHGNFLRPASRFRG